MKTYIETLLKALGELDRIPVMGESVLHMFNARTQVSRVIEEMAKIEQEKKEEDECLSE